MMAKLEVETASDAPSAEVVKSECAEGSLRAFIEIVFLYFAYFRPAQLRPREVRVPFGGSQRGGQRDGSA